MTDACSVCGYDRAGLREGVVCPECGSPPGRRRGPHTPAANRAVTSLGLGALSWLGLIGLGLAAIPLGIGAVWVAASALSGLIQEQNADPRHQITAIAGLLLGLTGALLGLAITVVLAASLL